MKLTTVMMIIFLNSIFLYSFEPHFAENPAISPDGQSICFSYSSDLFKVPFEGGEAQRLTRSLGKDTNSVFSSDGKSIAFNSTRLGWNCIYIIPAIGGKAEVITTEALRVLDWFPDGRSILASGSDAGFGNKFFRVFLDGTYTEFTAYGGSNASVNSDGNRIIFNHWGKPSREAYIGSGNGNLYEYNIEKAKYKKLTDTNISEMYPQYSFIENSIYFCGSDGLVFQIYKISENDIKNKQKVTDFKKWSAKNLNIAKENDRMVFEKFDEIWKYEPKNKKIEKLQININEDIQTNLIKKESVQSKAKIYTVSKSGELIVFSYKYDLFAVPEKGGDVVQITFDQKGINDIIIMDDNQTIYFTKFFDGEPKLYKTNITDVTKIQQVKWSEDKYIEGVFQNQNKLLINFSDTSHRNQIAIADSSFSKVQLISGEHFVWQKAALSADKQHLIYSELREQLWSNHLRIYNTVTKINEIIYNYDGYIGNIFWGKDNKTAFFTRGDEICRIDILPINDFANEPDNWGKILKKSDTPDTSEPDSNEIKIQFKNIEKRITPVVSKPGKNKICYVLNDSIFYYLNTFNKKTELRKTDYFGKEDKLIKSFSVGISNITYNKTNKRFYYTANNAVRKFNPNKKKSETIKYSFRYQYDKLKLNEDVFEQVWNKYGREFYDPEMHGVDWRESFHRFSEYTKYAVNTDILDKILEEMMGEVNASHTRFTPRKESDFKRLYQAYGGFELDFDNRPVVGIRFDKIYRLSKLNDPYNIRSGDILLSVDGKKITENTAIAPLFTDKAGEKIKLEIAIRDSIQTIMIKGLKYFQHKNIYYDDWVYRREQIVSELSNGRIGYVHIRYMNDRSYDKFMHDFYADNYRKDALIIDVRNNGGGNTHDKILEVLTKRSYARVSRRYFDLKKHKVPHEAWERPLALLINENSFSDAEIFPAIFQQFNLGKVVGMPTAGAVIGTNPFTLFDGSKMRLPQNGWYLPDGTNLEGAGAVPDILVEPTPEQIIADDDVQLKRVVKELLKEL